MEEVGEKNPAQWAIDLLEGKNYHYERRFYNKYTGEIMGGIVGATSPWLRNYVLHRPLSAGLQYHIAFGIVGVVMGRILTVTTDQYYAKRDAILLDYIKKYPQRFPEPLEMLYCASTRRWFLEWHRSSLLSLACIICFLFTFFVFIDFVASINSRNIYALSLQLC